MNCRRILWAAHHPVQAFGKRRVVAYKLLSRILSEDRYARWRGYGSPADCERQLAEILGPDSNPVFVFPPPSVAWGYLFQRPQQLARALVRFGYTVLYAADPGFLHPPDNQVRGVCRLSDGPILFADGRRGRMISSLKRPAICWQYWPHQSGFRQYLPSHSALIYDCLDDLNVFNQYPSIRRDHAETMSKADLVLASSDLLLKTIRKNRPDAIAVPNAVTYEDFANPPPRRFIELDDLRRRSKVIVGYYGALAEWIDWDLLLEVSAARRDWTFLLVGDVWMHLQGCQRLRREPNVHIWARQAYERLGRLLASFDVAIIPFRVNELTHAVSPIKLFEYMAGGKPVVATPLEECRKFPVVRLGASPKAFIRQIEWSLGPGQSPEHRARLQSCAAENTWLHRATAVLQALVEKSICQPLPERFRSAAVRSLDVRLSEPAPERAA